MNQTMTHRVSLTVSETKGIFRQNVPITQGVPVAKGSVVQSGFGLDRKRRGAAGIGAVSDVEPMGGWKSEVGANRFLSGRASRRNG